ncbi:hypothetical protein Taro_029856 [Colocasia esculenta]|uniref:CCHC-type domain-containing protein n=1 Tax=Colocasia esculenta TaxID=4460 RepID=A0A843VEV7_COLES|nr:hypothetical protein [Colocasia esculenta]
MTYPTFRCYNCGQPEHLARNCLYPREQTYGRRTQQQQPPQWSTKQGRGVPYQRGGRGRVMAITRAQEEASNLIEGSVRTCKEMFPSINFLVVGWFCPVGLTWCRSGFRRLRMLTSTSVDVKIFSVDANGRILAVNQVLAAMSITMVPRQRPREGVAEQATRQEAGDAPPPQQTQPLPQDAHSGIVLPPPPPPPQAAQGLDWTQFLEGMAQFVAQHRDALVPQGSIGRVLMEFLQFQPPQFLGQPDLDTARAWLDAVERTFRSIECVPEERVLLASYQLQAQALTWWSSEWETNFQSRPLRQIPWQEFVVSFERAFCPTYVRTERLYQFLDLQQRDSTVVQYRARFVELGRYAPQIMADESLRTQQFVRGLRSELRQALIVARVTNLDAAYQTAAALEADTLRTRVRSAEVQTQGSVQTTTRTTTSYASTSAGTTAKSGSQRKFRRDKRQTEQRQQSVGSVQQSAGQPSQQVTWCEIALCYLVCRSSRPSHSPECSSSSSRFPCSNVSRTEVLVGRRRLPFQASLATPVLVCPSCSE